MAPLYRDAEGPTDGPASGSAVGAADLGARSALARDAPEGQRKHLADQPLLAIEGGRLDLHQVLAIVAQQAESALVAVDDEQFADADLAVEGDLFLRVVARAFDLHQEVRAAEDVRAAIDGPAVLQDDDDVRDAVVLCPVAAPVADVGSGIDLSQSLLFHDDIEDAAEVVDEFLLVGIGCRQHDVHTFPDFVVVMEPPTLAVLDQYVSQFLVAHQHTQHRFLPG